MKTKDLFLILGSICFVMILGAAVYEHIAVIPAWSAAPPKSLTMYQGEYGLHAEYFWMAIHPVTLLLLIIALVTNWKNERRKSLLIVIGSYVLIIIITSIYFVPELISITSTAFQDSVDNDLVRRSSRWEMLSLVRLAALVILCVYLLRTLTKSGEAATAPVTKSVPLAYPNDSLGG